jgi:hypothetical protein
MSALRLLVLSINTLAAVAVLGIGAIAWFVSSDAGAVRAVAYAAERAPADVGIAEVDGTLAGGLILRGVTLRAGDDVVTAERVALSFSASSLVARALVLNAVELRGVVVSRAAALVRTGLGAADEAAGFELPIVVRAAAADSVTLRTRGEDIVLGALRLSGRRVGRRVVVDDFRGETAGVALTGRGELEWGDVVELLADVNWAGDVGGERAVGFLRIAGVLPELEIRHELLSPVALVAHADAAVARGVDGAFLELDPLALDTDRGTLTGRGRIALDTTAWELTFDARDAGPSALFPERPGAAGDGRRFEGQLLPRLEWSAAPQVANGPSGG